MARENCTIQETVDSRLPPVPTMCTVGYLLIVVDQHLVRIDDAGPGGVSALPSQVRTDRRTLTS